MGATRRHIAAQFLIESASMGVVGGLLGSSVGVLIVVGVSAYQVWTPVLDPLAPLLAAAVGGVIGLLFCGLPASGSCPDSPPPRAPPRSNRPKRSDISSDIKPKCRSPVGRFVRQCRRLYDGN